LSSLDDLCLDAAFLYRLITRWFRADRVQTLPDESELNNEPHRRIAVFIPLWREHRIIGKMLEHNLASCRYEPCDFFIGTYPNDPETVAAVRAAEWRYPNVHLSMCPHDGPTSKADCLNWIFQSLVLYEEQHGIRYEVVVTHDAEDVIHPDSLPLINHFIAHYDMVQVPVLPIGTAPGEITHGLYCDEFAEFQSKDIPVRQMWGGFLPSNGVGTGYSRRILEKLAEAHSNRVFESVCLTEDYENGYRIHALGGSQIFLPLQYPREKLVATREYFPRTFRAAVRQRTRWTMGIALQGWERHGWRVPLRQLYWFWRDRKGLVGNLVAPAANVLFLYGLATWILSRTRAELWQFGAPLHAIAWLCWPALLLTLLHLAVRVLCVRNVYGWALAAGVPFRAMWGNWINLLATVSAIYRYLAARMHGRPLVWLKTEHMYPNRAALASLEICFQLVTPGEFEELAHEYLAGSQATARLNLPVVSESTLQQ